MKILTLCGLILIFFFGIGAALITALITNINYDEISK